MGQILSSLQGKTERKKSSNPSGDFKILIKDRKKFLNKKVREILPLAPEMVNLLRTSFGDLWILDISLNAPRLVKYLKEYVTEEEYVEFMIRVKEDVYVPTSDKKLEMEIKKHLAMGNSSWDFLKEYNYKGKNKNTNLYVRRLLDHTNISLIEFLGVEFLEKETWAGRRDLLELFSNHQDILKFGWSIFRLFTKPLPEKRDDLKKMLAELKKWNEGQNNKWYYGWTYKKPKEVAPGFIGPSRVAPTKPPGHVVMGLSVKVRDFVIEFGQTLSMLEKSIDQCIKPIKKHLSMPTTVVEDYGPYYVEKCLLCGKTLKEEWLSETLAVICKDCYDKL